MCLPICVILYVLLAVLFAYGCLPLSLVRKMREKYRLNAMDRAGWLDPVSLARVDQLVAASADPVEIKRHQAYQTKAEAELRGSPSVVIEMPCFAHPIIHDERPYPGVPGSGGGGGGGGGGGAGGGTGVGSAGGSAVTGIPDGSAASPDDALVGAGGGTGGGSNAYTSSRSRDGTVSPPVGVMSGGGLAPRNGSGEGAAMGMAGAGGRAWGDSDLMAGGGVEAFLLVSDYEMEEDNPGEIDPWRAGTCRFKMVVTGGWGGRGGHFQRWKWKSFRSRVRQLAQFPRVTVFFASAHTRRSSSSPMLFVWFGSLSWGEPVLSNESGDHARGVQSNSMSCFQTRSNHDSRYFRHRIS